MFSGQWKSLINPLEHVILNGSTIISRFVHSIKVNIGEEITTTSFLCHHYPSTNMLFRMSFFISMSLITINAYYVICDVNNHMVTLPRLYNPHGAIKIVEVLLTLESIRTETTTSRGYKSPCVFIEVVLLFISRFS
jgi:hypothetical protein